MTNKELAIRIVFGMFMAEYEGDAVEVYNKLSDELADSWDCIDYANVWDPARNYWKASLAKGIVQPDRPNAYHFTPCLDWKLTDIAGPDPAAPPARPPAPPPITRLSHPPPTS